MEYSPSGHTMTVLIRLLPLQHSIAQRQQCAEYQKHSHGNQQYIFPGKVFHL